MAQVINTNIASLNAQRNLNRSQGQLHTSLQRLSSGMRINSAKDDAAGLAISERFTAQIKGLNQAIRNSNDGISLSQTAEGALGEVTNNLQRVRELAIQAVNATNSASDRAAMQQEVAQLISEIDRVATQTNFNGVKLLDGSFTAQTFQVGANVGETITVSSLANATAAGLGLRSSTASSTSTAIGAGALNAGDLTINGIDVGAVEADAAAIAAAIAATRTNISATATNTQTIAFNDVVGTAGQATTSAAATGFSTISVAEAAPASAVLTGFTDFGNTNSGETFTLTVDGVTAVSFEDLTANGDFDAEAFETQLRTFADNSLGLYEVTGSLEDGDLTISRTDGADLVIAEDNQLGSAVLAAGFTGTHEATEDGAPVDYSLTIDGETVLSMTLEPGESLDAAAVEQALKDFVADNDGYAWSGSFDDGDFRITKADGSEMVIAETHDGGAGLGLAGLKGTTSGSEVVAPAYSFTLDGQTVDLTNALAGDDATVTGAEVAAAINAIDGFEATFEGGNLIITKLDGSNFTIGEAGADAAGAEGLAASETTYRGTVSITSTGQDLTIGGVDPTKAGLTAETTEAEGNTLTVETVEGANALINAIDLALDIVNGARATLGAIQNRFESVVTSLQTSSESLSAARSRIQDTDFAAETAQLTKAQILQQAGMAMMAQANSLPQGVLSLLQG